ncbi:unnamed protein product, partial [Rotaria sp. Silwood2]
YDIRTTTGSGCDISSTSS